MLEDIIEKRLFCNNNGQLTIKGKPSCKYSFTFVGIIISFKKKKKDLKATIGPAALVNVPIYILELPEECSDPILGTLESSQEYRHRKCQVLT